MNKVKIQDIKTGAIKEVAQNIASDYVGTGRFKLVEEKKQSFVSKSFIENKGNKTK